MSLQSDFDKSSSILSTGLPELIGSGPNHAHVDTTIRGNQLGVACKHVGT